MKSCLYSFFILLLMVIMPKALMAESNGSPLMLGGGVSGLTSCSGHWIDGEPLILTSDTQEAVAHGDYTQLKYGDAFFSYGRGSLNPNWGSVLFEMKTIKRNVVGNRIVVTFANLYSDGSDSGDRKILEVPADGKGSASFYNNLSDGTHFLVTRDLTCK